MIWQERCGEMPAMDTPIVAALISAAAVVVVAPAISYYLTKKKERDADWQMYKFEQYREFVTALGGIVGADATPEGTRRFAVLFNTLHLSASHDVITALHEYHDEIRDSNTKKSPDRLQTLVSKLIWAIRRDLDIRGTPRAGKFVARLLSSGKFSVQESAPDALPLGGKAEEELKLREPGSGFLDQDGIRSVIEKSGVADPGEKIRDMFLLFQTSTQRTWLAASSHHLFCLLDDEKTRTSRRLIQWRLLHKDAGLIAVHPGDPLGTVDIGPRRKWLYSARLHSSPEELKMRIEDLLKPSVRGSSPESR